MEFEENAKHCFRILQLMLEHLPGYVLPTAIDSEYAGYKTYATPQRSMSLILYTATITVMPLKDRRSVTTHRRIDCVLVIHCNQRWRSPAGAKELSYAEPKERTDS